MSLLKVGTLFQKAGVKRGLFGPPYEAFVSYDDTFPLHLVSFNQGGLWFGVDINSEDIMDNFISFVWEPALVRVNALTAASEAACLILR